jgi:hypothetical protein
MPRVEPRCHGQRPADSVDAQSRALQHSHHRVPERDDSLRVKVLVEDAGDEILCATGSNSLRAHGAAR